MKIKLTILIYFFSIVGYGQLQKQISFSQLSVNDGLSQNSVVSIAQDSIGYLWLATQDGLNKYDGKEFVYYQKLFEDITKETYSKLGKIYVDRENNLYIISKDEILEKYDSKIDSFKKLTEFPKASVIYQDTKLNTWVGTFGNGLHMCNKRDTLQVLHGADVIKGIFSIAEYQDKIIAAASGTIFEVDPITFEYEKLNVATTQEFVNFSSIETDDADYLWIGSYGSGLFHKSASDDTLKVFSGFDDTNAIPENLIIQDLLFDSKKRLWVCTYGEGVYLVDFISNKISSFKVQQSNPKALHYNDVLCAYEDYTGTIWLGTDGAGVSYYDENLSKFNSMTNASIPAFADVAVARAITIDSEGGLWIGTSGKGLTYYDPNSDKYISYNHDPLVKNTLSSDRVMSLFSENNGLWIGFQDEGLAILRSNNFIRYDENSNPPLSAKTIWCIFKDSSGKIWLGTRDNGLILFDPDIGVVKNYVFDKDDETSISSNNVRVITEGKQGELWVGTENKGLNKLFVEEESFKRYTNNEIRNIKSLYFDNNQIWIGTNGNGLQVLDLNNEGILGFTVSDGLPNNVIYAILPDENNDLWLSSNRGISKFEYTIKKENIRITNFDNYDGLQALEFNTGASFKSANGLLYFGGLNGINWFRPSELSNNPIPPKTVISKIEVFDEEVNLEDTKVFSSNKNTFTFNFAGLHFSQPDRNEYKYILKNYDKNWSKPSSDGYAHYTNLPHGDYNFSVVSSNYDGIWDNSEASYSFTINAPWYLTIWAKIGYVFGILIILLIVYYYLKWRWEMQVKLKLEHSETERLKKLDELKSKLYTNISHEFRTPLTLISGPLQELIANTKLTRKDKNALQLIDSSSQRLLRLVNQLLDLSKLETGSVALQVGPHDLNAQISQVQEVFKHIANEKGIKINARVDNFSKTWYDSDILEKLLFNLFSNAIKYAPENSEVAFNAKENAGFLDIEIQNKSENISENDLTKLFDRFFQVDKNSDGVGIGLSLIKELVILSNGTIIAEKKNPKTISFKIRIPVQKEKYNANTWMKEKIEFDFIKNEAEELFILETGEKPLLLVVEDNNELRKYIVSLFQEYCSVLEAKDGLVGIKKAIKNVPDLIISDVMMPNKDGIELCNTLKQDTRTCHIPIFLITAKAGDASELIGLRNKADDYITKPFNAEIVRQKVKNIINSRKDLQKRYSQNVYLRPKDIAIADLDEKFLVEVQKIINTKFTQPDFTSDNFAKELALSRMQLHRKLKALTGLSTSEFIRSQRLKTAADLLKNSELTISEIGYSVGFNTPSYFTRCFKDVYGCNPSEYLEKQHS